MIHNVILQDPDIERLIFADKQPVCGFLNTGMQLLPYYWMFKVHSQFGVHVTLLQFHLPSTVSCHQGAVLVGVSRDPNTEVKYCGKRTPWTMAYHRSYVYVTVLTPKINKIPYGFYFKMIYEAIDVKSHHSLKYCIKRSILEQSSLLS